MKSPFLQDINSLENLVAELFKTYDSFLSKADEKSTTEADSTKASTPKPKFKENPTDSKSKEETPHDFKNPIDDIKETPLLLNLDTMKIISIERVIGDCLGKATSRYNKENQEITLITAFLTPSVININSNDNYSKIHKFCFPISRSAHRELVDVVSEKLYYMQMNPGTPAGFVKIYDY